MNQYKVKDLLDKVISGEWGSDALGENDVSVIRTTNFTNTGKINLEKEVVKRNIAEQKVETKRLRSGDIIIEKSGGSPEQPVGRVVYFDIDEKEGIYLCNNFTSILRTNELVDSKFLFYYLFYQYRRKTVLKFQNKTTGIINLKLDNYLRNIDISLPSLEEQKQIVAILDKTQGLIEKRKEVIAKLDELVQSVFLDMFGEPIKNPKKINKVKLDKLGEWKSGGTPPRKKSEYYQGDIPWYSSGELNDTYIGDSIECISRKAIDETSAKLIEPGSLLLGMYDTAALKSSVSTRECSCNQAIAFSKLNKELASTLFVYYVIQLGRDHYKRQQRGVRQKNLNLTMIRDIEIILPSLEKQQEFVDVAEKIKQQKLNMQKSFVMLENNFQSLLHQAFKGELKVDTEITA